jgi:hypothetical protein
MLTILILNHISNTKDLASPCAEGIFFIFYFFSFYLRIYKDV